MPSRRLRRDLLPAPFPLQNTGATCHFNSLVQALASCPLLLEKTRECKEYLMETVTGKEFYKFFMTCMVSAAAARQDIGWQVPSDSSNKLLKAMLTDLRARTNSRYTAAMQSVTEGFVLLFDMIETPSPTSSSSSTPNPFLDLFKTDVRERIHCGSCRAVVSNKTSSVYQRNYFDYDKLPPADEIQFAEGLMGSAEFMEDYKCEKCGNKGVCSKEDRIVGLPTIMMVVFNQYRGFRKRYYPASFDLRCEGDDRPTKYTQVAQIENNGGHYWTAARRQKPGRFRSEDNPVRLPVPELTTATLNDSLVAPGKMVSTPFVYVVLYHIDC